MNDFKPFLAVSSTGIQSIGKTPSGTVSIASDGVTGTVGVFVNGNFKPHPDGAIADGTMFTFEVGQGREIGINVTAGTGGISTVKVA